MKKPLVSVLMPSRDRYDMALESILSLGEGNFEVLLYIDDDDPQKDKYLKLPLTVDLPVIVHIRPRLTYYKFHEMINELSRLAKGDWLLIWNDDAYMQGQWLQAIEQFDSRKVNVMRFGHSINNLNLFPAISRKMYEVQGFYSPEPHCDSWAMDISKELGCERWVHGMTIEHRKDYESLNDATKAHTVTAYSTTIPLHGSKEVQAAMRDTINKLREYV